MAKHAATVVFRIAVDVPLKAGTLADSVGEAQALKVSDIVKLRPGVTFNDFEADVACIHTDKWL